MNKIIFFGNPERLTGVNLTGVKCRVNIKKNFLGLSLGGTHDN